jgi:hypothetical protein
MPMRPPTQKEKERKAKLVKNYMKLLNATDASEMSVKPFLDANPSFIPMPWMLNHQLHFKVVLPQLPLATLSRLARKFPGRCPANSHPLRDVPSCWCSPGFGLAPARR